MSGGTKEDVLNIRRLFRDPPLPVSRGATFRPRAITKAWLSITATDIQVGELLYNRNDDSLVYRKDNNIFRFDSVATRAI
jgi:hypothetical protein